ncbi:hypothetical protein, partial [Nocardia cerradoensis]|uniref:hypothetical protein n=1 Tax=Nocardia cerradoensis TaxID=85688 RepID=UPI001CB97FE0
MPRNSSRRTNDSPTLANFDAQSFVQSTLAWRDAGWHKVGLKPEVGGTPAPAAVKWAIWELLLGAQP